MKIEKAVLKSWARALVVFCACLVGVILLWVISKISGAYWVYGLYLRQGYLAFRPGYCFFQDDRGLAYHPNLIICPLGGVPLFIRHQET